MFKNICVLYVEDEEIIRNSIVSVLQFSFKEFILAVDGEDGFTKFMENKDKIDLVITDINMPKMDGLDMLAKIKEESPLLPMLITTAHNELNFLHKAIDVGVTGYVTKPIDVRKLIEILKKNILPVIMQKQLEEELKNEQAEKIKIARFSAIGQLSAGITHEINTPLTYIKATFEMMQYDIDDLPESSVKNNMKDDTKVILDGILRMENIIASMKEMSSQQKVEKEDANIYATLVTALMMTHNKSKHISKVTINDKEFTTLMNVDTIVFNAKVQKQRVEQVWIIIINNAMDELMKDKLFNERTFDIKIENIEDKIKITFKDNAGGISEDIKDDLFEAFKSTKESSGMGVGLSIAQKIIEENNGTIRAYNEDNGAVFEVIL